jgi:hypothetical protein
MKIGNLVAILAITIVAGCATPPQQAIQFDQTKAIPAAGRIGVAMVKLPEVDTQLPGAGCLLCVAAAQMANSTLTEYSKTLPYEELPRLKNDVADLLKKKGTQVVLINEDLSLEELKDFDKDGANLAKKDFSPVLMKYGVDKLLVIQVAALGFERRYSAYFPMTEPKGLFRGTGYIVNSTNTYEWYMPVEVLKSADGQWDEAPKFPGLTNAYFQALELGRETFLKPFN